MSGHSHWAQIKHKKGSVDEKKGKLFSKLLNAVAVAARDNPNPDFNPRLRTMIEKARTANVPQENIERAIKKSSETKNLEEILIEAYGPEKVACIIHGITDNKNRTLAEIRALLTEGGAKIADPGSVLWSFTKTDEGWKPTFSQPISEGGKTKIQSLISLLEEHPDVDWIVTNAQ